MGRLIRFLTDALIGGGGYVPGVDEIALEDGTGLLLVEDTATDHFLLE